MHCCTNGTWWPVCLVYITHSRRMTTQPCKAGITTNQFNQTINSRTCSSFCYQTNCHMGCTSDQSCRNGVLHNLQNSASSQVSSIPPHKQKTSQPGTPKAAITTKCLQHIENTPPTGTKTSVLQYRYTLVLCHTALNHATRQTMTLKHHQANTAS